MLIHFVSLPSSLQIAGWAGSGLLMTLAGYILVRKLLPLQNAHVHNGELGTMIAVVGIFYALIIATMLARAVNHFDASVEATRLEASVSASLYRAAAQGSPELARRVQKPLLRYLDTVVHNEWPKQISGMDVAQSAPDLAALSVALRDYLPDTPKQLSYLNLTQDQLNQLYVARHARLSDQDMTIPADIWGVNFVGEMTL
ncbi:MAG: hypothetical protein QOI13_1746, partial [Paraburkholderia sp.]|nr:hypothetical protein [Paraburkholderia sp.]